MSAVWQATVSSYFGLITNLHCIGYLPQRSCPGLQQVGSKDEISFLCIVPVGWKEENTCRLN